MLWPLNRQLRVDAMLLEERLLQDEGIGLLYGMERQSVTPWSHSTHAKMASRRSPYACDAVCVGTP